MGCVSILLSPGKELSLQLWEPRSAPTQRCGKFPLKEEFGVIQWLSVQRCPFSPLLSLNLLFIQATGSSSNCFWIVEVESKRVCVCESVGEAEFAKRLCSAYLFTPTYTPIFNSYRSFPKLVKYVEVNLSLLPSVLVLGCTLSNVCPSPKSREKRMWNCSPHGWEVELNPQLHG